MSRGQFLVGLAVLALFAGAVAVGALVDNVNWMHWGAGGMTALVLTWTAFVRPLLDTAPNREYQEYLRVKNGRLEVEAAEMRMALRRLENANNRAGSEVVR